MAEVETPSATATEAVVQVYASSINRGELRLLSLRSDGWGPGQDTAGVVLEPALDGSGPPAGTRVVGLAEQGAWSECVLVPGARLVPLPDSMSMDVASCLPIAAGTALGLIQSAGHLIGRRALITGAGGAVGRFAVQLSLMAGANVTGVAHDEARAADLIRLGISDVVTDLSRAKGPFDLILDSVGGPTLEACLGVLGRDSLLVSYGNSSDLPARLSFETLHSAGMSKILFYFNYQNPDQTLRHLLQKVVLLVAENRLDVEIGLSSDWTDAGDAVSRLRDRQVRGKAVLRIS